MPHGQSMTGKRVLLNPNNHATVNQEASQDLHKESGSIKAKYDSIATVGEIRVYWRADFQSGSRVLKKVF